MATWYSVTTPEQTDRLLAAWPGAPVENEEQTEMLLEIAREQVLAFAPLPTEGEDMVTSPPARYVYAQLQQAKNLWAAGTADESGNIGTEGYSFQPRPLDKTIRALIRPTTGAADAF